MYFCLMIQVEPDSDQADEGHLPDKPDNFATDKKLAAAYKDARAQQLQRIEECRAILSERALSKVSTTKHVAGMLVDVICYGW